MSIVLTKSSLSLVVSLQTSCSLATCFLIRLTSTYLPHQMAPFSCLCLARIYEHFHVSRLEHGWAHPSLRLCTGINRRGPNSLIELGRAVFLHHFAPFFCLHLGGAYKYFILETLFPSVVFRIPHKFSRSTHQSHIRELKRFL